MTREQWNDKAFRQAYYQARRELYRARYESNRHEILDQAKKRRRCHEFGVLASWGSGKGTKNGRSMFHV